MLNLLEFMLKCYQQSIEKYNYSNRKSAWLLWLCNSKEYGLTIEKRLLSSLLYLKLQEIQKAIENQALSESAPSTPDGTQDELADEYGFQPPASVHSETVSRYWLSTPIRLPSPMPRSRSAGGFSPYMPLFGNTARKVLPFVLPPEPVQAQDVLSTTTYGSRYLKSWYEQLIDYINAQHDQLSVLYLRNKDHNSTPHRKGAYDDLLKAITTNIAYIRDRELYVAAILERLRAAEQAEHYAFEKGYREHLLVLIERVLSILDFDKALYKGKHSTKHKKEYYAITGAFAKLDPQDIESIIKQLKTISDKLFVLEKDRLMQFVKVYAAYQEALRLFSLLPGVMVEKCCLHVRDWQISLDSEYRLFFVDGLELADHAARYIENQNKLVDSLHVSEVSSLEDDLPSPPHKLTHDLR